MGICKILGYTRLSIISNGATMTIYYNDQQKANHYEIKNLLAYTENLFLSTNFLPFYKK